MIHPWQKRAVWGIGIAVAFVLLSLMYAYASRYYPLNSDTANAILEARDVVQGNVLLSHWHLTTVSYFTTDILPVAFGLLFQPFRPGSEHNIYGAIYAIVVLLSVWLASRRPSIRRYSAPGALAAFAVLAFPAPDQGQWLLLGPLHGGTMLWIIPALLALDFTVPATSSIGRRAWVRLVAAAICLALALIGDTMALYIALGPIALVSLLRLRSRQGNRFQEFAILGVCVTAEILSKAFQFLISRLHGYQIPPESGAEHVAFVAFDHLAENIRYALQGLLRIFNADFFGMGVGRAVLIPLLSFAGLLLILRCLQSAITTLGADQTANPGTAPLDRIVAIVAIGMVIDVVCYALCNLLIGLATLRYLVPFSIYAGVLAGRYGAELWHGIQDGRGKREVAAVFLLAAAAWCFPFAARALKVPLPGPSAEAQLGSWLQARGLTDGYAGYWAATSVTVETSGAVRIYPVSASNGGFEPFLWAADERWYTRKPVRFLVVEDTAFAGVDLKNATAAFGRESARYRVARFTILVWDKDISALLKQGT